MEFHDSAACRSSLGAHGQRLMEWGRGRDGREKETDLGRVARFEGKGRWRLRERTDREEMSKRENLRGGFCTVAKATDQTNAPDGHHLHHLMALCPALPLYRLLLSFPLHWNQSKSGCYLGGRRTLPNGGRIWSGPVRLQKTLRRKLRVNPVVLYSSYIPSSSLTSTYSHLVRFHFPSRNKPEIGALNRQNVWWISFSSSNCDRLAASNLFYFTTTRWQDELI